MTTQEQLLNQPRVVGHAVLIGSLLLLYWLIMPVVVGGLADARGLREDELGWLASTYSAGICVATFASIFWIRRVDWKFLVRVGSLGAAGGFILVAVAESYSLLLLGHALASLFTGFAYAVIMALLGDSRHPARNYALVFFLQVVLGVAASALLPVLASPAHVPQIAAAAMVIAALSCCLLAGGLTSRGCRGHDLKTTPGGAFPNPPIFLALVAIILIYTGDSGIWVFLERIGTEAHDRVFGGTMVSVNLAAGALGSLTAAWLGDRWGYWWPMVTVVALSIVSLVLLRVEDYRWVLITASVVNGWAWNFGSAYRMALVARLDHSGRFTVLIPSTQTLGNTLGPAVTGILLVHGGYTLTFSTIAGLWCIALLCYLYAWRNYKDEKYA